VSLQNQYGKFATKIKLTRESAEYNEAKEKDALIKPKIEKAFEAEGYVVLRSFQQGSLASFTGIIPLDGDYDIDRGIVITKASSPDNPIAPKLVVKRVLKKHGFKDPKIKKPCVTANYESKSIHIDYVVYRENTISQLELAVGKEYSNENQRYWDAGDPEGLKDWITWKNMGKTSAEREQFYRLVRYLKRWRDNKYTDESKRKKVFSIGLGIMIREQICFSIDSGGKPNDHKALTDTLDKILNNYRYFTPRANEEYTLAVELPKSPWRDVFEESGKTTGTLLRNRLKNLHNKLLEVDGEDTLKKKCIILRKEFGDDFPESNDDSDNNCSNRTKTSQVGLSHVSSGA
jgi:hypothetical protein